MVKHIVLYTLKEGTDKEKAVAIIKDALEPLVGVIPGLKHLEIRQAYQGGMDYALYSEFESREALAAYATHDAHLAAKEKFWTFLDKRFCADYEL
jgi:heme-degrading monooxygenase HmoA